jgi:hypothetical protein
MFSVPQHTEKGINPGGIARPQKAEFFLGINRETAMTEEELSLKKLEDIKKKEARRLQRSREKRALQRRGARLSNCKNGVFRDGGATIKYEVPNLVPRTTLTD